MMLKRGQKFAVKNLLVKRYPVKDNGDFDGPFAVHANASMLFAVFLNLGLGFG